jgi:hypothetical protein
MRRRSKFVAVPFAVVVAVLMLGAAQAGAANTHFKAKPPLTFSDQGVFLRATGAITGLGNGDVVITLTATGQPTATCTNPAGATQPAGQNPVEVTLTGLLQLPASDIKNGNLSFGVNTAGPVSPVPGAPECPNPNWTENITDVAFSSATITVYQPCTDVSPPISCPIVLQQTFTLEQLARSCNGGAPNVKGAPPQLTRP